MYKVLIVEDMDLTREDLISLIDWERYGFELLPDARNGKIGLEYAKRYRPDIVITDIKMPVMTGLDLVEQMKKENIEAEVILLTAYEEFELAKRALQMGVRTFILKYEIDEEVLLRELNGCIEALKTKENVRKVRMKQYLEAILAGKNEIGKSDETILEWIGKSVLILLEQIGKPLMHPDEEGIRELIETELPGSKIRVMKNAGGGILIFYRVHSCISEMHLDSEIREFITKVQSLFSSQMGLPMAASIGGMIRRNKDILPAKETAEEIMKGRVFHRGICILDKVPRDVKEEFPAEIKETLRLIEEKIEKDYYEEMSGFLENVLCRSLIRTENVYIWRKVSEKLLYFLMHRCAALEQPEIEERLDKFKREFQKMDIYSFMKEYEGIIAMLENNTDSKYSGKIRYIKAFIEQNYSRDISLNDVADDLGMNAIYLSQLFKKETGSTFSAYLTRVRMNHAIRLLRTGEYKIYEVSDMVGYQTVQYFSIVFKKETGKNPKDY